MEASSDRQLKRCPSTLEHVIAVVVTLLVLEQHSRMPEANFFVVVISTVAVLGLGVAYLATASLRRTDATTTKRPAFVNWIVLPVAVTLMLTSSASHWPATLRFYLSKPSFDGLVAEAYSGRELQGFPRWVGLYRIDSVQDSDFDYESRQGTIGFVTGVALIDECGLYYDQSDQKSSHYLTTRIAPHWYVTEW
jgi:hypothetical protein